MAKIIDVSGQRFGKLLVTVFDSTHPNNGALFRCICDCGIEKVISGSNLRRGKSKSCGCLRIELGKAMQVAYPLQSQIHGAAARRKRTAEYVAWLSMRQRCKDPNHVGYSTHGGRGIVVCEEWANDFPRFLSDMGQKPSRYHSLERINTNGNYVPSNCIWATAAVQQNNRRNCKRIQVGDIMMTVSEAAKVLGITTRTLYRRRAVNLYQESPEPIPEAL